MFNSGSVTCGGFVEFEEPDGCIYENINYKYQYEKQTSENKIANELSHVANLFSVTVQNSGKEINTRFMLCK